MSTSTSHHDHYKPLHSHSDQSPLWIFLHNLRHTLQKDLHFFYRYMHAILYISVVVGSYIVLVMISFPKVRQSPHVPDYHLTNAHITFVVAVTAWCYTLQKSPGVITPETLHYYDHYEYDELLYVSGHVDDIHKIPKLPRTKYDRFMYNAYVPRFDHYCGWVGNTIGEENYRVFLGFVCTQYFLCLYTTVMMIVYARGELSDYNLWEITLFDTETGDELRVGRWMVMKFLVSRHPAEAVILAITGSLCFLLSYFLCYHFRIASANLTTNEDYKWQQVKEWHRSQVNAYERNVEEKEPVLVLQPLVIPDGDVGCSGGGTVIMVGTPVDTEDKESDPDTDTLPDPGPMPPNIYDQGFVENWKEVLFPISLRKKQQEERAKRKSHKN